MYKAFLSFSVCDPLLPASSLPPAMEQATPLPPPWSTPLWPTWQGSL